MADTQTIDFDPAQRATPPIHPSPYTLAMPKQGQEQTKAPFLQKALPFFIIGLVLILVISMMFMGIRRFNPMFMMFPAMMLMSLLGLRHGGGMGGDQLSEINTERKNWFLGTRETRKRVRAQGSAIHRLAVSNFPNPSLLGNLSTYSRMWQVKNKNYPEVLPKSGLTDHPFLAARAGVGLAKLTPEVTHEAINVPETYEPVSASAFGRFKQVQKYVANCPIGVRFDEERSYGFRGPDPALRVDAVRPMIMSLAQNHSPNDLAIGVIADPAVEQKWDWIKWLPHSDNTMVKVDQSLPYPRLAWSSVEEFGARMAPDLAARQSQGPAYRGPHLIVFIDTPSDAVTWPVNMLGGNASVTFVAVRFSEDRLNVFDEKKTNLIQVDSDGTITVSGPRPGRLKMDRVSLTDAENFARNMARYVPSGFGTGTGSVEKDDERVPSWFSFLGVGDDLSTFDPRVQWAVNSVTPTFRSPIGYRFDMGKKRKLPEAQYLDMIEVAKGGTGPHGVIQGITGAGKSFLLQGIVLSMCAIYGPDKACFILADFKGGAAFDGWDKLPHVIAVLTNLAEEKELIDRAQDIIEGELIRRQRLLRQYGCENAVDYRNKRRAAGDPADMPTLPDLFIFVDEFYEFLKANRQYIRLFSSVGSVGRSLGVHMIPCSQFMDETLLGDLSKHIMFGISLTSSDASFSRKVIGTDDAVNLVKGSGQAIIRQSVNEVEQRDGFIGFNHAENYTTRGETTVNPADPRTSDGGARSLPFGLYPTEDELLPAGTSEVVETVEVTSHDISMRQALMEHLCKFQEVQAPTLWQPSITVPMTLRDTRTGEYEVLGSDGELRIRLGDIDNPREHARPPLVLAPKSCVGIYGDPGTGKSMTLMTMVATTALTYRTDLTWMLADYRGGCAPVEHYPNVASYATKHDVDTITRILGEAQIKIGHREALFAEHRITDTSEFMRMRKENPNLDDTGYLMVGIDGIDVMLGDAEDTALRDQLIRIALNGPKYGVFLVVTAPSPDVLTFKLSKHFGSTVLLRIANPTQISVEGGLEVKGRIKALPHQPGRGLDPLTGLYTLVMVPRMTPIPPEKEATPGYPAEYKPINNSAEIRATGEMLSKMMPKVRPLSVVGSLYTYATMWEGAMSIGLDLRDPSVAPKDRWLPLGVDVGTLNMAWLRPQVSPHVLITGDANSGRTATLREIITTVTNMYSPTEAKFVIVDPSFRFLNEQAELVERGYMKPSNYATNDVTEVAKVLKTLLEARTPKGLPSPQALEARDWFTGPEIFVIVNAYHLVSGLGMSAGPLSVIEEFIRKAPGRGGNLGVHLCVATEAKGFANKTDRDKLCAAMVAQQTPILMLSGPANEMRVGPDRIKFEKRRPGRGLLYTPNPMRGAPSHQTVQVAWTEPWGPSE